MKLNCCTLMVIITKNIKIQYQFNYFYTVPRKSYVTFSKMWNYVVLYDEQLKHSPYKETTVTASFSTAFSPQGHC